MSAGDGCNADSLGTSNPSVERQAAGASRGLVRRGSLLGLLTFAACCVTPAWAQEPDSLPPDTVYALEELRVQVTRPVATAGGASALTTRLDSLAAPPSPTLEEALRRVPLIQIRENSRGEAQPQLRGMESRQVAILVDGVPITLGWDNRTDLSVVPLTAARELTLVRGLSSVLHGPNALGGVVLVSIAEGTDLAPEPPVQFSAGIDGLGNSSLALGLATAFQGEQGKLTLRAGGGYRDRSASPLPSGVQQPDFGPSDERLNSDFEQLNGYVVARYRRSSGSWASLSSFGYGAERGVPPELNVVEPRLWRYPNTRRWVTALSAGTGWQRTPLGRGDLEASFGIDLGETEIDTYESLAYDSITGGESGDDRTLSLRLLADHTLGGGILRGAMTLAETRHEELIEPDESATYRQRFFSLGLEVEGSLIRGSGSSPRARASVGLSVDGSDTPETGGRTPRDAIWGWGARAGGSLVLGSGDVLLHGGLSRRLRFPALRELYSGALGRFVVNEGLDPEVLGVAELGLTAKVGGLEGQVVAFYQRLSDAIVRVSLGDGRLQRQNREVIRSAGAELLGSYSWRDFSLSADLTLKDVTQEDPAAPAQQRNPEYQPWITGGAALSAPMVAGVYARAQVRHVGRRYCVDPDSESEETLAADTWLDLEFRRGFNLRGSQPGRHLELALAVDNVTDAAAYDQCGLPQPGRLLRLQVRIF
ncbi:MAG: TonB-dependent receptor [Gemmatimonadota bacterium]|nr:MAG: TonB-dependent receptor [Gemmatimonadota bacterium]